MGWTRRVTTATSILGALALSSFFPHRPVFPPSWSARASRSPAQAAASSRVLAWAHSHNDYEQPRPLLDALDNRVGSIEADVYLHEGELQVSHLGYSFTGTLKSLYLDPLQERVSRLGSVYGDGTPVWLWLDIKERDPGLLPRLHALLSRYPMLTSFAGGRPRPGAVTVVLTGNPRLKRAYVEQNSVRYALRDNLSFDPRDPASRGVTDPWRWYALDWFDLFAWDGTGELPEPEARKLRSLVAAIHAKGRKLRFWGSPDTPEAWRALYRAGVDLVGTDYPDGLRKFSDSGELEAGL